MKRDAAPKKYDFVAVAISSFVLFLSGVSALLFQTLWLRLTGLAFGNSIWAAALILSSFMAGLALGSAIAARLKLQRIRPLRLYALLELIIGVSGCVLVFGLPNLGGWLRPAFQALWEHQALLNLLRFSLSFLILLMPTTAMGLALPVLLADPIFTRYQFGRVFSALYGFNTLGAVAGALMGEGYLIQKFGLLGTGLSAAIASTLAAALAWIWSLQGTQYVAPSPPPSSTSRENPSQPEKMRTKAPAPVKLLIVSFGSGALFLALEVIWFRFLRLYVSSTSTAVSIMLAVVLAGIGLGGLVASAVPRRASPRKAVPIVLLLAGIATLLSYIFFPIPALDVDRNAFDISSWGVILWLSVALMFPVALLSGILLPVLVTCLHRQVNNRMNSAGLTLLFNTAGATAGPLFAAFVLLPTLGFQLSLVLVGASYGGLAFLGSERDNWSFRQPFGIAQGLLGTALVLICVFFPYHRDETHFANAIRPYLTDGSILQKRIEGTADTFQLLRRDIYAQPYYYRLVTNSYSMSGTLPRSQRYMRLFAYLPLALRPNSQNALLLCYGVGVTADALVRNPDLKHIDMVDTAKEVFDLAKSYSGPIYSNPLNDPRVTTVVQDARFFLQSSPRHYDIITGEPPPLKTAGTVNLYTQQFFKLVYDRLGDGGIATFWLPIYQLTNDETKAILGAFHNAFPNASVWSASDLEWVMMGCKAPLAKPDRSAATALWSRERTRADLERIGLESPAQMSSLFLMDGEEIDKITTGIEPLTDLYPKRLTDVHPNLEATYKFARGYLDSSAARRRFLDSALIGEIWPDDWKKSLELFFLVRETRFTSELSGSNWLAELQFYLRGTRLSNPVLGVLNTDEQRLTLAKDLAVKSPAQRASTLADLTAGALAGRDLEKAVALLEEQKQLNRATPHDLFLLIYLDCLTGNPEKGEAVAAQAKLTSNDWFSKWLWGELQAEFGFRPPLERKG